LKNLDWAKMANYIAFGVIGLGFLAMYLGWNGAANKACVDCQIPYLLSGGALGLGLIATGIGVLLVQNGKRNRLELESKLEALLEAVDRNSGLAGSGVRPAPIRGGAPKIARGQVLAGDSTFHAPDCHLAQNRDVEALPRREALARGLEPCRVCNP
jgi:hypothetical protein